MRGAEHIIKTVINLMYIQFTLQLLISEYIFLVKKERRQNSGIRFVLSIPVLFGAEFFWTKIISRYLETGSMLYAVVYLGFAGLTYLWIWFNYEMSAMEVLFVTAGGYATEHMAFCATRVIVYLMSRISGIPVSYLYFYGDADASVLFLFCTKFLPYIVAAYLVYYFIVKKNAYKLEFRESDYKIVTLVLLLMVSAVILSQRYNQPEYWESELSAIVCPLYGFICCLLVLIMVYYILWTKKMQWEQESMEQLIRISENQQKATKEAIDIINIKCHDLKHQIHALGKIDDANERKNYIEEIKSAVSIYDAVYHTGNEALDYVLREKTLLSGEYGIKLSAMTDGSLLKFMHAADIYALMSNAIDNAFEASLKESEEKRIVSFQIQRIGQMVLIHLENWCSHAPEFLDGIPQTDKKDKTKHGFGVKSIQYIAEKYDGEVNMCMKGDYFYLDIFFPVKKM